MKNERSLLAEEEFLMVPPTLACAIGLNEAIVLQRLYWLLKYPQNGKELNGHRWIYNTYPEWKKQFFPFWSEDTIMRVFNSLEGKRLVVSIQPEGSRRRKYYRPDEGSLAQLTFERFEESRRLQSATLEAGNLPPSQARNLPPCYYINKSGTKRPAKSRSTVRPSKRGEECIYVDVERVIGEAASKLRGNFSEDDLDPDQEFL